jgi:hypothetical protein
MHRPERWKPLLMDATSEAMVASIIHDYVETLLPSERGKLPPACQRAVDNAPNDVAGSAVILTREELAFRGDGETAELLRDIAQTLIAATNRIAQIRGRANFIGPK